MPSSPTQPAPHVLVVDDEPNVRRALARLLSGSGYTVHTAADGEEALTRLAEQKMAAIVTDIVLPGIDGIELLRRIRSTDPDLPVVVITGGPRLETAIEAMRYGALRYLVKPVDPVELRKVLHDAIFLGEIAAAKRAMLAYLEQRPDRDLSTLSSLETTFSQALASMELFFQPIVDAGARRLYAFEALLRPRHPELSSPDALLQLGERLDAVIELGRRVRTLAGQALPSVPDDVLLFVNLHVHELSDEELYLATTALSPQRVVFEITERHSLTDDPSIHRSIRRLKALGYRVAIDDFGAGHAGLTSFALLEPDVVKIDMDLVRDIDRIPTKRQLVASMVRACDELGVEVVAEGVERVEELRVLRDFGCRLVQGYLFAHPEAPFADIAWPGE